MSMTKVLHVEDDPLQQRVLAHHLKAMPEFQFEVVAAETEDKGLEAFQAVTFDLVLLDYQLKEGNGLHLLRRLRQIDPIVPIIAISGVASSEVAADLVQAGADDYFNKSDLTSTLLARSVRNALLRAATVRNRTAMPSADTLRTEAQFQRLCQDFRGRLGMPFFGELDALEKSLRDAKQQAGDMEVLFRKACSRLDADQPDAVPAHVILRPLLLELLVRIQGSSR